MRSLSRRQRAWRKRWLSACDCGPELPGHRPGVGHVSPRRTLGPAHATFYRPDTPDSGSTGHRRRRCIREPIATFSVQTNRSHSAGSEFLNLQKPFPPLLRGHAFNHSNHTGTNGPKAAKTQDISLQTLEAVSAEVPAIEQPRHAHGNDDAGTSSTEQF